VENHCPPSVENHPGGSTTNTWNSHSRSRGGVQNAVCQGPINQTKLPLTHTGRRHTAPQAEAVHGEARDHSMARAGVVPTAGRQADIYKNTRQLPHRRQRGTEDWRSSFWNWGVVMSQENVMEWMGLCLWIRKRPKMILTEIFYPRASTFRSERRVLNEIERQDFKPTSNVPSHVLVSALNTSSDIDHELLTFMEYVYKPISRKWNMTFQRRRSLILSPPNQPSPHRHVGMETLLMCALVLEVAASGEPWWNQS